MDPEAVVLDISSDEEEVGCGEDENRGVNGGDDYDWISELLDEVDRETTDDDDNDNDDDDDDVVVVDEKKAVLNLNPKQRLKSSVKDLDDDCVILDGDPDKPVEVQNNPVGESEDVLVVSEKGQVACRDYPHARHLCAKFPFNSSQHESHCDQCHCYVCDSRVPCIHWGTGTSSIDHCHATDKDEYWVLQRKSTRNGEQSPKPILNSPNDFSLSTRQPQVNQEDFSLSTRQPQINQVPPSTIIEPNYMNEVCRPMSVRSNTNFSLPNIINPNRNPRTGGYIVPRNKFQTSLVLHHRSNGYNSFNPRDRRHGVGNLGPQSISPRPVFKRSGSFGSSTTTNRCVYNSSNNTYGSQFSQNTPVTVSTLVEQNPSRWQDFSGSDIVHPEPSSYWTNSVINQDPCQPRVPCQPNSGFGFVNSVPPHQPHASSLPSVVGCYVSTVPSVPNVGPACGNLQVPLEPYMSGVVENSVPSQALVYSQPVSVSNDSRNVFCQESQSQVGPACTSLAEFDFSWVNPSGQINQTPIPVAENTVLEGAVQMDGASLPMEYDQQQFPNPNPDPLAFQYDSWILSGQSVSGAGLNVLSPEPAPIDSGIFFDL